MVVKHENMETWECILPTKKNGFAFFSWNEIIFVIFFLFLSLKSQQTIDKVSCLVKKSLCVLKAPIRILYRKIFLLYQVQIYPQQEKRRDGEGAQCSSEKENCEKILFQLDLLQPFPLSPLLGPQFSISEWGFQRKMRQIQKSRPDLRRSGL